MDAATQPGPVTDTHPGDRPPAPLMPAEPASAGPQPTPAGWSPVVRVNLLPREITEARRFAVVQRGLAAAVLVTVGLGAAGVWWAAADVAAAEEELAAVQARTAALETERARYAEVPRVLAEVAEAEAARAEVLAYDVAWYRYLTDLALAAPDGVELDSVAVALTPVTADTTAVASGPLEPLGIATLTVGGRSPVYPDVASWLERVDALAGVDVPTLTSAAAETVVTGTGDVTDASGQTSGTGEESTRVVFNSGATVTGAALSHRYDGETS